MAPSKVPVRKGSPCPRSPTQRSPSTSLSSATSSMASLMSMPCTSALETSQHVTMLTAQVSQTMRHSCAQFEGVLCIVGRVRLLAIQASRALQGMRTAQALCRRQRARTTQVWPCSVRAAPLRPEPQPRSSSSLDWPSSGSARSSRARSVSWACSHHGPQ